MSTTVKLYDPAVAELWIGIAKRYAAAAERELYEIFPKTIGVKSHLPPFFFGRSLLLILLGLYVRNAVISCKLRMDRLYCVSG